MKFKIKSEKKDNSHPVIKIAVREWLLKYIDNPKIVDIYGGKGMMYEKVWSKFEYRCSDGDSIEWLLGQPKLNENIFDIDPYASPFEALKIIAEKAALKKIGIVCTDGYLRRVSMMRTGLSKFFQENCNWPERSLTLMAGIYHKYPSYLRHVLKCIAPQWRVERLVIQYGRGTWKQATVYFSVILIKDS